MTVSSLIKSVYAASFQASRLSSKTTLALLATAGFLGNAFAIEPRGESWKDSYSVDGQCYCDTTFDHDIGDIVVDTPAGRRTVFEVCEALGPGPGSSGNPIYNDVQCGNGPPNDQADEVLCPGRVDIGEPGCFVIGPTWNLEDSFPAPELVPEAVPDAQPDVVSVPEVESVSESAPAVETDSQTPPVAEPMVETVGQEPAQLNAPSEEAAVELLIEAENFTASDMRWVMQDGIQDFTNDPFFTDVDALHLVGASGGRYLEILPDKKHSDAETAFGAVWPIGGEGPQIHYEVEFAETGRYQVMVLGFSSGEFDKRIHVGLDGLWPVSGSGVELCSAIGTWGWSAECGTVHWLDVLVPGVHSVQFSAFDDGFEMDQFRMVKIADLGLAAALDLPGTNTNTETDAQPQPASTGDGVGSGFSGENVVTSGSSGAGVGSIASLLLALIAGFAVWRSHLKLRIQRWFN